MTQQHDLDLANQIGAAFRADLNLALLAVSAKQWGPSAPPTLLPYLEWADTTTSSNPAIKIYDGASWAVMAYLDTVNHVWQPVIGGGTDTIASAGTTDLSTKSASGIGITGTTTITSFGTVPQGQQKRLTFAASLTLTYNATSMKLPGGRSIQTRAGDTCVVESLGAGNWQVNSYTPAGALPSAGLLTEDTIASSGTTDLGTGKSNIISITGTTTITSFGSNAKTDSPLYFIRFGGALTLTHNGTSLIIPGAANITTAAGDTAVALYLGSGNWRIVSFTVAASAPGASASTKVNNFRLSLTTGVPVTTTDVTGATTIYCVPYNGSEIALYDGTKWNTRTAAQFSLALGTLTSGKPYDVFCYDNAGTPTLEFLVWTNDTTRATALAYQDGVLVKSGTATRRYLGTFYTTSTTTTEDSLVKRFLYNYNNRILRPMKRVDATATWTYTTNAYRQANNAAANQLDFVQGVAEDTVSANVVAAVRNTIAGTLVNSGIGLDSTTTNSSLNGHQRIPVASYEIMMCPYYTGIPGVGRHYLAWLESSGAAGTTTWIGDQTSQQSGIAGQVMA